MPTGRAQTPEVCSHSPSGLRPSASPAGLFLPWSRHRPWAPHNQPGYDFVLDVRLSESQLSFQYRIKHDLSSSPRQYCPALCPPGISLVPLLEWIRPTELQGIKSVPSSNLPCSMERFAGRRLRGIAPMFSTVSYGLWLVCFWVLPASAK